MRITKYRIENDESKASMLVKEDAKNYSACDCIRQPEDVYKLFVDIFRADKLANEHIWLLCTDIKGRVVGVFEVSHGSVAETILPPREIFTRICLIGSSKFFLVHNHPSGDSTPSGCDITNTKKIKSIAELMGTIFCDHIIIGDRNFVSMSKMGII